MRILLLSFYYEPDLSAGSFRATALVDALSQNMVEELTIDVLTTMPNRYKTFSVETPEVEIHGGISVHRIPLPAHESGMLDQSRSFLIYSVRVLSFVASKDYDVVVATSSRLMTAVLAAWISRRKKIPLYLDIRDIFVDTINEVFPRYLSATVGPLFRIMERYAVSSATKVNLVSAGFEQYFSERYREMEFTFFTNGIDDEFVAASGVDARHSAHKGAPYRALYAGNIGEGQGLHAILPELARRMSGRVCFRVIGDGGRKIVLQSKLSQQGIDNVEILAPMNREQLITEYRDADVLFLHLNDHAAFTKVLPSKLFEYAAMGKPIWAGVAGYAADFVRSEISNAVVFNPCNSEDAERSFEDLKLEDSSRGEFVKKYERKNIMLKMAAGILNLTSE